MPRTKVVVVLQVDNWAESMARGMARGMIQCMAQKGSGADSNAQRGGAAQPHAIRRHPQVGLSPRANVKSSQVMSSQPSLIKETT